LAKKGPFFTQNELVTMVDAKNRPIRYRGRVPKVLLSVALLVMSMACGDRNTYAPPPPPKVTVSHPVKKPVTNYTH
jgi:hypothetical protein